jgi:hypothetical protein
VSPAFSISIGVCGLNSSRRGADVKRRGAEKEKRRTDKNRRGSRGAQRVTDEEGFSERLSFASGGGADTVGKEASGGDGEGGAGESPEAGY